MTAIDETTCVFQETRWRAAYNDYSVCEGYFVRDTLYAKEQHLGPSGVIRRIQGLTQATWGPAGAKRRLISLESLGRNSRGMGPSCNDTIPPASTVSEHDMAFRC